MVIAFFEFNESFAGEAALERFKSDLDEWVKHTKAQDYSGKGALRIALVSPIAAENLGNPNYPTGDAIKQMNARLEPYTKAMRDVAEKNGAVFADVFAATNKWFDQVRYSARFTINGVHLIETRKIGRHQGHSSA